MERTFLSIGYLEDYFCSDTAARPFLFIGYALWLVFLFSTLGISASTNDEVSAAVLHAQETALVRRLRVLRPVVNVVGRGLLGEVRQGSLGGYALAAADAQVNAGWDAEVWRCLRGLVEVMEWGVPRSEEPAVRGLGVLGI